MALISLSVIPFGPTIQIGSISTWMQLTDLNIGVLFVLAASSMGVYGIALAGWASNNKYALLGGLRSSAQMISYELPMSLAIAAPLLISNTLSLRELVETQNGGIFHWNLLRGPFPQIFSFVIFLIAAFAETNRVPFDLPEAENELVAGFHTEYSSMKFASFFMAEYANMITVSCMAVLLFLGGWDALWPARYGSSFVPVIIFALIAVVCAINVVVQTHPISSAISLVGVMGSLAILYLLLGAEFIAAAQVIVYAGAVMVLFVFVIMLLNAGAEERKGRSFMVQ